MRVLFVSGIDGPCHRYQVLHRAAQLARVSSASTVRSFVDPRLAADVEEHDVVFLYRAPLCSHVEELIESARRLGCPLVGSIDDLLFDVRPESLPALEGRPESERALWLEGIARYAATLDACDAFVGSTEVLVAEGERRGWRAHLHRNALSAVEVALADRARARRARNGDRVVIGYLSGTPTHDEDFAVAAPAIAEVLHADRRAHLLVIGPLHLPEGLAVFADRVRVLPLVSWTQLPAWLAQIDVNIAPLDLSRRFVAAKGEVKYLEAAALGVPTVASPSPSYRHAIGNRDNGRLAANAEDWRGALSELVADVELRRELGESARRDLEERWSEETRARELADVLGRIETGSPQGSASRGVWREPSARLALEPDACPALPLAASSQLSPPLGNHQRIEQRLRPTADGLVRIDLHTVTFGQDLAHRLRLRLVDEDGSLIGESEWRAQDAPERGWMAFDVRAQPRSRGRTYTLVVEADGAGKGNALSFGLSSHTHEALDGPARMDGSALAGPLAMRAFANWPDALAGEIG